MAKVTKRKDGFFEVEGVAGYFSEADAKRVSEQMKAAAKSAQAAETEEGSSDEDDDGEDEETSEDAES